VVADAVLVSAAWKIATTAMKNPTVQQKALKAAKLDPVSRAVKQALDQSVEALEEAFPQRVDELFDATFLNSDAATAVFAAVLTRGADAGPDDLSHTYARSLTSDARRWDELATGIRPAAMLVLETFTAAAKAQEPLWALFDAKALDDIADWARSVNQRQPVARSVYLSRLVEPIAPQTLIGREEELAELGRFCLTRDPKALAYAWWQAGAWAGKSALVATFAISPPQGVDVVAFFITSRSGAYDNRGAFTDHVQEQLDTLLGQPPIARVAATVESHLLDDLARAARQSAARGRRLVLIVDGLDEDAGHSSGRNSIAGLLGLLPEKPRPGCV
jgi:hypothetical protein